MSLATYSGIYSAKKSCQRGQIKQNDSKLTNKQQTCTKKSIINLSLLWFGRIQNNNTPSTVSTVSNTKIMK